MIIGIGNDITDIRRIEKIMKRFDERFIARCFTKEEQEKASIQKTVKAQNAVYAKRFAAKEACAKALGSGIARGVRFCDMGVHSDENGKPSLQLTNVALERLNAMIPSGKTAHIHASLSDDYPYAQAFVVIEAL